MLNTPPDFKRFLDLGLLQQIFVKDGQIIYRNIDPEQNEHINAMTDAFNNLLYGGSVLKPLRTVCKHNILNTD